MDRDFAELLKAQVATLKDDRERALVDAIEGSLVELKRGVEDDGNWERVRRAMHILKCALKWHRELSPAASGEGG